MYRRQVAPAAAAVAATALVLAVAIMYTAVGVPTST